jgi:hypothetical protein
VKLSHFPEVLRVTSAFRLLTLLSRRLAESHVTDDGGQDFISVVLKSQGGHPTCGWQKGTSEGHPFRHDGGTLSVDELGKVHGDGARMRPANGHLIGKADAGTG